LYPPSGAWLVIGVAAYFLLLRRRRAPQHLMFAVSPTYFFENVREATMDRKDVQNEGEEDQSNKD
jgi:hypothetical protein